MLHYSRSDLKLGAFLVIINTNFSAINPNRPAMRQSNIGKDQKFLISVSA